MDAARYVTLVASNGPVTASSELPTNFKTNSKSTEAELLYSPEYTECTEYTE